jgi:hypothetical protein
MTVVGTRVLKVHVDAAKAALHDHLRDFLDRRITGPQLAELIAAAVVTATDGSKTYYCVGCRLPDGNPMIFGPFATRAAADRAMKAGALPGIQPGTEGKVFPLLPAGATPRKKTTQKGK